MPRSPSISMVTTSGQDVLLAPPPRRWPALAALALALGVMALWGVIPRLEALLATDRTVSRAALQIATVERGAMHSDIVVRGRIVAARSPTLHAPSQGRVLLHVEAGDRVQQDQLLATVENPELVSERDRERATLDELSVEVRSRQLEVESARFDRARALELAELEVELARSVFERSETLRIRGTASMADLERDAGALRRARLELRHARDTQRIQRQSLELALEAARSRHARQAHIVEDLERKVAELRMTAPIAGEIGTVEVRPMDFVLPHTPMLTVVDLTAFEVGVEIPEAYADDLSPGLETRIEVEGQHHRGRLVAISPEVTTGQVVGRVRFVDGHPAGLRQHQRVTVRILIEARSDVLKVRRGAFVESGGARTIYVVDGAIARRRSITLGARGVAEVEIASGLHEGERVIISSIENFASSERLQLSR